MWVYYQQIWNCCRPVLTYWQTDAISNWPTADHVRDFAATSFSLLRQLYTVDNGIFLWPMWTSFCYWINQWIFYQTDILIEFFEWLSLTWQFASITSWAWRFSRHIYISKGTCSVATQLRRDGIFKYDFVANLPLSLTVKEFWKSVDI